MKIRTLLITIIFIILILPNFIYAEKKKRGRPPAKVTAQEVQIRNLQSTINLVGTFSSVKTSQVSSEFAGLVGKVLLDEGDVVKKGTPLVILRNSQLMISIKEAKAALDETKEKLKMLKNGARESELKKAKAQTEEAEIFWKRQQQELNRVKNLFEKKLMSENDFMNSFLKTNALEKTFIQKQEDYILLKEGTRKEEISMQAARVKIKKAQLEFLLDKKKKTKIISPFDGVVINKLVEEGEWINQGKNVMKIIMIDPIRVDVLVPENVIYKLKKESEISIEVDAIPGKKFNGKISNIIPEASSSSRSFLVRVILPNREYVLKSGMTARILIPYGLHQKAVMIPQDSLIVSGNRTFVYKVSEDNTARMVPIKPGRSSEGWIEAIGELKEKDMVISKGNERLRPGQPISLLSVK